MPEGTDFAALWLCYFRRRKHTSLDDVYKPDELIGIPLPKIGSFVVQHNGFLRLTNRPLSLET